MAHFAIGFYVPDVTEILTKKGELFDSFASPIPDEYGDILTAIAKTSAINYEWGFLVRIFACKMIQVLQQYFVTKGFVGPIEYTYEMRLEELLTLLLGFTQAPFTVQRVAELLTNPTQYNSTHKLMNSIEKLLMVTSTIASPFSVVPMES